jgi:redox-sensitive bicupin YhaK (pirin superfamily)
VTHSEFNASKTEPVHFLQIWLLPAKAGIAPGYEQKTFTTADKQGRLRLVASPDGKDGSVTVHTDARLFAGVLAKGEAAELPIAAGRHAWVQVVRGRARVNGKELAAGDGAALSSEPAVRVEGSGAGQTEQAEQASEAAEVLVFDLA